MNDVWLDSTRRAMAISIAVIGVYRSRDAEAIASIQNAAVDAELRRGMQMMIDNDFEVRTAGIRLIDGLWREPAVVRAVAEAS